MTPTTLPLDEFVGQFHSPDLKIRLRDLAQSHDLVATRDPSSGRLSVAAVDNARRAPLPPHSVSVYIRPTKANKPETQDVKSRTQQALDLVDGGMSAYAAAKALNLAPSAVNRALQARKRGPRCPTCGQIIRNAEAPDSQTARTPQTAPGGPQTPD